MADSDPSTDEHNLIAKCASVLASTSSSNLSETTTSPDVVVNYSADTDEHKAIASLVQRLAQAAARTSDCVPEVNTTVQQPIDGSNDLSAVTSRSDQNGSASNTLNIEELLADLAATVPLPTVAAAAVVSAEKPNNSQVEETNLNRENEADIEAVTTTSVLSATPVAFVAVDASADAQSRDQNVQIQSEVAENKFTPTENRQSDAEHQLISRYAIQMATPSLQAEKIVTEKNSLARPKDERTQRLEQLLAENRELTEKVNGIKMRETARQDVERLTSSIAQLQQQIDTLQERRLALTSARNDLMAQLKARTGGSLWKSPTVSQANSELSIDSFDEQSPQTMISPLCGSGQFTFADVINGFASTTENDDADHTFDERRKHIERMQEQLHQLMTSPSFGRKESSMTSLELRSSHVQRTTTVEITSTRHTETVLQTNADVEQQAEESIYVTCPADHQLEETTTPNNSPALSPSHTSDAASLANLDNICA